jgi:hypothetical protein
MTFFDSTTNNSTKQTYGKTMKNEFFEISEEEENKRKLDENENEVTLKSEGSMLKSKKTRKNGRINFPVELVRNFVFEICLFHSPLNNAGVSNSHF